MVENLRDIHRQLRARYPKARVDIYDFAKRPDMTMREQVGGREGGGKEGGRREGWKEGCVLGRGGEQEAGVVRGRCGGLPRQQGGGGGLAAAVGWASACGAAWALCCPAPTGPAHGRHQHPHHALRRPSHGADLPAAAVHRWARGDGGGVQRAAAESPCKVSWGCPGVAARRCSRPRPPPPPPPPPVVSWRLAGCAVLRPDPTPPSPPSPAPRAQPSCSTIGTRCSTVACRWRTTTTSEPSLTCPDLPPCSAAGQRPTQRAAGGTPLRLAGPRSACARTRPLTHLALSVPTPAPRTAYPPPPPPHTHTHTCTPRRHMEYLDFQYMPVTPQDYEATT